MKNFDPKDKDKTDIEIYEKYFPKALKAIRWTIFVFICGMICMGIYGTFFASSLFGSVASIIIGSVFIQPAIDVWKFMIKTYCKKQN